MSKRCCAEADSDYDTAILEDKAEEDVAFTPKYHCTSPDHSAYGNTTSSVKSGTNSTRITSNARDADAAAAASLVLCPHPPCSYAHITFPTIDAYEAHYEALHRYTCTECRVHVGCGVWVPRAFGSARLLELHCEELHDPLLRVVRERAATEGRKVKLLKCFEDACKRVFSSPHKRRLHLIDAHAYPRDYDFNVVLTGVCYARLGRSGRDATTSHPRKVVHPPTTDDSIGVEAATEQVSRLFISHIPDRICFGRGSSRRHN